MSYIDEFCRPHTLNKTMLRLILEEPVRHMSILDAGCGAGTLTFWLAEHAERVIGIDTNPEKIEEARKKASQNHTSNIEFHVADADNTDYTIFGRIDLVTAHYFLSDPCIQKAHHALPPGGCLIFVCLHTDNYRELGRPPRYAYTMPRLQHTLEQEGFMVEHLQIEPSKTQKKPSTTSNTTKTSGEKMAGGAH